MAWAFLSVPFVTGKIAEGANDSGFEGMGAGRETADKWKKIEVLIWV